MKIIKPLTLGVLHKPFKFQGEKQICVVALGFFSLQPSKNTPQNRFLLESKAFPKVLSQLPTGQPIDMVMPKGEAEFVVCGNAHSPTGKPVTQLDAGAQVGKVSKVIRVFGDRQWYYGELSLFKVTAPEAFTSMPLGYDKAFGSPDYGFNTLGQGYNPNSFAFLYGERTAPMPNLEYPQQPVNSHRKKYMPASLGPMDIMWQQRSKWVGTYDEKWIQNSFPNLADDADMRVHNVAAEDQRTTGYWQGGEPFQLRALHPEYPEICGTLPDFRVKAMLQMEAGEQADQEIRHQAVNMDADTVWFFPEENLGVMVYRAVTPISDPDGLDVKALLLAYEGADQPERSGEHYIDQISARMDRKKAAAQVLNEAALIPVQPESVHLMRAKKKADKEALKKARNEKFIAELEKDLDIPQSNIQKPDTEKPTPVKPVPKIEKPDIPKLELPEELSSQLTLEDIADGGIDLTRALASIDKQKSQLEAQRDSELKKLESQVDELLTELDAPKEADNVEDWKKLLEKASRLPEDLYPEIGKPSPDVEQLIELLESDQNPNKTEQPADTEKLKSLEKNQRAHKRAQTKLNKSRKKLSASHAEKLGIWLRGQISEKAPMAGRDLADVSALKVNFSGMDLREVNFEGANLAHANFEGANLFGANFLGANLEGANFSLANLEEANFSQCQAQGALFKDTQCLKMMAVEANLAKANFGGADLTKAIFNKAQLVEANLSSAKLMQTLMGEIVANNSCWIGADMKQTVLPKSQLENADFSNATMERAIFSGVKAVSTCWQKSTAVRSFFGGGSEFAHSDWRGAEFKTCGLRGVNLSESSCQESTFYQCDFGSAILSDADFSKAVLCRALFSQANLQRVSLVEADLHQAICRGTDFTDADLSKANLVHADMSNAVLLNTVLQDVMERVA